MREVLAEREEILEILRRWSMSKERRDWDYLRDIQDAMEKIALYTEGLTYDEFMKDSKTQDAVVRNLEVVGEATRNLSATLRQRHPQIPWRELAGVRDRLIHDYLRIDHDIVWNNTEGTARATLQN